MKDEKYKLYLNDLGFLLKEYDIEAKVESDKVIFNKLWHLETIYGNWKTNNSYLGIGWNMHFGRITLMSDKRCGTDSVFLFESQSGSHQQMMWNTENQRFTSSQFWVANCEFDGAEYRFTVKSPSGIQYIATKNRSRNYRGVYNSQVYVTEIKDANGNSISLSYEDGAFGPYVTEATSDDGKSIRFNYQGDNENKRLYSVSMPTETGIRTWQYQYTVIDTKKARQIREAEAKEAYEKTFGAFINDYSAPDIYFSETIKQLSGVVLPNNKSWKFAYNQENTKGLLSLNAITHPEGAEIAYTYDQVNFLQLSYEHPQFGLITLRPDMTKLNTVVVKKTLSGSEIASATWRYQYEPSVKIDNPTDNIKRLDKTTITYPKGIKEEYYHFGITTTPKGKLWRVGKLHHFIKYEADQLLERIDYQYIPYKISDRVNYSSSRPGLKEQPTGTGITSKVTLTRGQDKYITEYQLAKELSDNKQTNYAHLSPYKVTSSYAGKNGNESTNSTYEYLSAIDTYGFRITKTTLAGIGDTVNSYDDKGNLIDTVQYGVETKMTYHPDGSLKTQKNALGQISQFENYAYGIPQIEKYPENTQISRRVIAPGLVSSVTDARGKVTSYTYDLSGRLTQITPALGNHVKVNYADSSVTITRDLATKTDALDSLGRVIKTTYAAKHLDDIVINSQYDALGRQYFVSLPNKNTGLTTTFDGFNRTVKECNEISCIGYEYLQGNKVKVTDGEGNTVTNTYRTFGSPSDGTLIETSNDEGITVTMQKNLLGLIESVTSDGLTKTYEYDASKGYYLKSMTEPELGEMTFTTDALGNVLGRKHHSKEIRYTYDGLNRLTQQNYPDKAGKITYAYDKNGNPTEVKRTYQAGSGYVDTLYQYAYDDLNRVKSEAKTIGVKQFNINYQFDDNGNLIEKTYPSGRKVTYTPDHYGRITQIGNFVKSIVYDDDFSVKNYAYGNGLNITVTKDEISRITKLATENILSQTMVYDKTSNIKSIDDGIANLKRQLSYDKANRLTKEYVSPTDFVEYAYDNRQNIVSKKTPLGQASYRYNTKNLLTQITGVQSLNFTYDNFGQVTGDGEHTYAYLSDGTMTALDNTVQSYSYDANNHRVAKTDRLFVYDVGQTLLGEYEKTGKPIKEYVYLGSQTVAQLDYLPPVVNTPNVTGFSPDSMTVGVATEITLNGAFLPNNMTVSLGNNVCPIKSTATDKAVVTCTASTVGQLALSVTDSNGTAIDGSAGWKVKVQAAPELFDFTPKQADENQTITIKMTGQGLPSDLLIKLGGKTCNIALQTAEQLQVRCLATPAGEQPLSVVDAQGNAIKGSENWTVTVKAPVVTTITSVTPMTARLNEAATFT